MKPGSLKFEVLHWRRSFEFRQEWLLPKEKWDLKVVEEPWQGSHNSFACQLPPEFQLDSPFKQKISILAFSQSHNIIT
jgi:hypothetical protein